MPGQLGHKTRLHARLPHSFVNMDDLTNERSFGSKAARAIDVLVFFLTCYPLGFHNQALADVRSTDAGIKCLYCTPEKMRRLPSFSPVLP